MILETIITSVDLLGQPHITPFGVVHENDTVIISPYKPSKTLENILATKTAVMNLTDDVRVFAGALTQHSDWPLAATNDIENVRLKDCLAHTELALRVVRDDAERPQLIMHKVKEVSHRSFQGFNRAQSAVVELAVLVSRLHLLPREKIEMEVSYLQIAIDKTAGEREKEAWGWLVEKIHRHYNGQSA